MSFLQKTRNGAILFTLLWLPYSASAALSGRIEVEMDDLESLAAGPARAGRRPANEDLAIRKALEETRDRVLQSNLDPVQRKNFDDEIIPQGRIVVTGMRSENNGKTKVELDLPAIRRFLSYHAKPSEAPPPFLVEVIADPRCESCVAALPRIRNLANRRIQRRGFELAPPADPVPAALKGKPRLEAWSKKVIENGAWGGISIVLSPKSSDSVDTAHLEAGALHAELFLAAQQAGKPKGAAPFVRLDVLDTQTGEDAEVIVSKLLNEEWTQLGVAGVEAGLPSAEGRVVSTASLSERRPEMLLRLQGFHSFAQYRAGKEAITQGLNGAGTLLERKFQPGSAWFALTLKESKAGESFSDLGRMGEMVTAQLESRLLQKQTKDGEIPTNFEVSWDSRNEEIRITMSPRKEGPSKENSQ